MRLRSSVVAAAASLAFLGCSDAPTHASRGGSGGDPATPSFAIPAGPYTPGQSYFGRNNYIEYVAGNAPVIYTAPHGGTLTPSEIPDRTSSACGVTPTTVADLNTADLVRRMQAAHFARFGTYPHIIINNLHRRKLDANRPIGEAACGDAEAITAYDEWHDFIAVARGAVLQSEGKGWYMDMHGHGHDIQRLEIGYLTTGAQLRLSDATLDANVAYEDTASVNTMSKGSPLTFSALLRGASSLGTLYANNAFPSVPSSQDRFPDSGESYFTGGYNTARYGCGVEATGLGGDTNAGICGVQIEANYTGVRDNTTNRQRFAEVTAAVLETYLATHHGIQLGGAEPPPPAPISLSASGRKQKGSAFVDLTWSGATGANVDVRRNGAVVTTTANDGAHTDSLGKVSGTFTYKVCEAGTTVCSAEVSVTL